MKIIELSIPGCFLISCPSFSDIRGGFVKTYHAEIFKNFGIEVSLLEEFYSTSHKGVVRGLHFQAPPSDHEKFVYCPVGEVFDVFLDVRKSSLTYGKHESVNLSASNNRALFLPSGIAHGFCSLSNDSLMIYKTSSVYSENLDSGIHWDSCGIEWPIQNPIISERDSSFVNFSEFETPFI